MNNLTSINELSVQTSCDFVLQVRRKDERHTERVTLAPDESVTVGRSWKNAIAIQDQYVDAKHLTISRDEHGVLSVADMGTTNGSELGGQRFNGKSLPYTLGDAIHVGDTVLTMHDVNQPVEPAVQRSSWFNPRHRINSIKSLLLLTTLALGISLFDSWFSSVREYQLRDAVNLLFGFILVSAVWTIVLGLMGKLLKAEANMKAHWVLCCVFSVLSSVFLAGSSILHFNTHSGTLSDWLNNAALTLLGLVFIYASLSIASNLGKFGRCVWSVLLVGTLLLATHKDSLFLEEHQRWSAYADNSLKSLPSAFLFRSPSTIDSHFENASDLFDELNKEVKRSAKNASKP